MILAEINWDPLIIGFAASLPALIAVIAGVVAWKHKETERDLEATKLAFKLREMELTGLKTLHHVNSGTVISARNLEVVSRQLAKVDPTEENEAAVKAAALEVKNAIIIQNETANLIRSMGGSDTAPTNEPIAVVLSTPDIKGTGEQLATKQDLKDALKEERRNGK